MTLAPETPSLSIHRYPKRVMAIDYARSAFGLAVTAGPVALIGLGSVTSYALALAAIVFLAYGGRTALRNATTLEMTEIGLNCRGARRIALKWDDLRRMKLAYFSMKRRWSVAGPQDGWMQLTLAGETGNLVIESTLDDFGGVVRRAASAALAKGLRLDAVTRANLLAMGIALPPDEDNG